MDDATPVIDWTAVGAELMRLAPDGMMIDYTPRDKAPTWASEGATWFIGTGDIEAFGATLQGAIAELVRLQAEAVQA